MRIILCIISLVSVGFFDDLFVPAGCLPLGCTFDATERIWIWNYEGNSLYIDLEEYIRVRVLSEKFVDVPPVEKDLILAVNSSVTGESIAEAKEYSKKTAPYIITVS
jgi:DNA-directed RNA polymerase III subunit RPC8